MKNPTLKRRLKVELPYWPSREFLDKAIAQLKEKGRKEMAEEIDLNEDEETALEQAWEELRKKWKVSSTGKRLEQEPEPEEE